MAIKFHEKAIAIYGVAQIAENNSAVKTFSLPGYGTITTNTASTAVVGVGTKFTTKASVGDFLYSATNVLVGTIAAITDDTHLTLAANAATLVSGAAFQIGQNETTGTISNTGTAVTGVGTLFTTELTIGAYIYTTAGLLLGKVASVASDTAATLAVAPAAVAQSAGVMGKSGDVTGVHFNTGLGPDNALAVLNLNYSSEIETESFQWTGDETSRDEATEIKDKYAKFDFETFMPALGTLIGGDPTEAEVPLSSWMQSSGFALVLSTGSAGYAKFTNAVSSNEFLTIEIRRSSPDLAADNVQKSYIMTDCRGLVDFTGTVGTKVKLKFNYMGNLVAVRDKITVIPNFSNQKSMIAPTMKSQTVTLSELTLYPATGTEPSIVGASNVCFDKLNAPNMSGFEYTRYMLSCFNSWDRGAVPTDVTVTILEDRAEATYNPDNHIEESHVLTLKYGNTIGKRVALTYHKLVLAKTVNSKIAKSAAQDLNFRNAGHTDIILS